MDQEHQVNLQVLQDLIQEFLVCQMVRVVQIDQMVPCHQADQQVLMDRVGRRDRRVREDPEVLVVLMALAVLPDLYLRQAPEVQMVQVVLENRQVQVDLVDSRAVRHYQEVQKGPMVLESQVVPEVLVVPADRMAQLDRYFQANQQDLGFQVRQEFHCRLAGLKVQDFLEIQVDPPDLANLESLVVQVVLKDPAGHFGHFVLLVRLVPAVQKVQTVRNPQKVQEDLTDQLTQKVLEVPEIQVIQRVHVGQVVLVVQADPLDQVDLESQEVRVALWVLIVLERLTDQTGLMIHLVQLSLEVLDILWGQSPLCLQEVQSHLSNLMLPLLLLDQEHFEEHFGQLRVES